jgi:alcohol dehydrogenase
MAPPISYWRHYYERLQVVIQDAGVVLTLMDVAKLVAVLWDTEQTIVDIIGVDKVLSRRSALAQVPTTSGTGSEAGTRSLVTNPQTGAKMAVESRFMLADLAVLDPE